MLASPIAAVPGLGTAPLTTFGAAPGGTLLSDTSQQYIGADMQICTAGSVAFSILTSQGGIFNYACFSVTSVTTITIINFQSHFCQNVDSSDLGKWGENKTLNVNLDLLGFKPFYNCLNIWKKTFYKIFNLMILHLPYHQAKKKKATLVI